MSVLGSYLGGQQRRQMNMMEQYQGQQSSDGTMSGTDAVKSLDFSPYATGGATRPDSFSNMDPNMQRQLYSFLQAADQELGPGLQVYSGYRSPELQASLYENALEKYGSEEAARKWVAPPGRSRHNTGHAADLKFNGTRLDQNEEVANWVRTNAPRYGLDVPMAWEPWQVELAGVR